MNELRKWTVAELITQHWEELDPGQQHLMRSWLLGINEDAHGLVWELIRKIEQPQTNIEDEDRKKKELTFINTKEGEFSMGTYTRTKEVLKTIGELTQMNDVAVGDLLMNLLRKLTDTGDSSKAEQIKDQYSELIRAISYNRYDVLKADLPPEIISLGEIDALLAERLDARILAEIQRDNQTRLEARQRRAAEVETRPTSQRRPR